MRYIVLTMGLSKTDLFTEEQNRLAGFAKVFAHPARVAILMQLLETNACVNTQLVSNLGLAQSTISQHLKELKNAGVIKGVVEGNSMNYCINPDVWTEVKKLFNELFDQHYSCQTGECC